MKKKIIITAIVVIILLSAVFGFMFSGRERAFSDILPANPKAESAIALIQSNDMESSVSMPDELLMQFMKDMDEFKYKKVTESSVMDSFGRIIYYAENEHHIEIMFSNERGGSILVNDIDKDGNDPVYKLIGDHMELEKFFQSYLNSAARQNMKPTEN